MMPDWADHSQQWMQRMIGAAQGDIELIASRGAEDRWEGRIDCFCLLKNIEKKKTLRHRIKKIYYSLYAKRKNFNALRTQIKNRDIDCLLMNFVGFGLKTRSVWEGLGRRVFVHIHGYDIAIEGRSDKRSN